MALTALTGFYPRLLSRGDSAVASPKVTGVDRCHEGHGGQAVLGAARLPEASLPRPEVAAERFALAAFTKLGPWASRSWRERCAQPMTES